MNKEDHGSHLTLREVILCLLCSLFALEIFRRRPQIRHRSRMFIVCISVVRQSGGWFPLVLYIIACNCLLPCVFGSSMNKEDDASHFTLRL
jgi:hypothetical protein